MAKITIDLDEVDIDYYRTKEDWDQSRYSRANYNNRIKENTDRYSRQGHFDGNGGPLEIASCEPDAFPCIAIKGGIQYNSNGADEMIYTFIYKFTVS